MTFLVGSAIGMPGESTTFDVVLQTAVEVMETQNDIVLGPEIRIAVDELGQPRCAVNPDINKNGTSFALHCDGSGECTLRAVVRAFDNDDPIPSGYALYTCDIDIDPEAAPDTYALACAISSAGDADGNPLSTACVDGSVEVGAEPTVSSTPAGTPLPPPATATIGAARTETPSPRPGGNDGDGCHCQVTTPAETLGAWHLVLPLVLLWLRRQRRSDRE